MQGIRIRHFFDKRTSRLVATIATLASGDNNVLMSVARCNPKDLPSKKEGRELAIARLQRFFLFKNNLLHGEDLALTREELRRKLVVTLSRKELLEDIIQNKKNPFTEGNCKFGGAIAAAPSVFKRAKLK